MNDNKPPPIMRRRDVLKRCKNLTPYELESWEENGLIHPFQKTKRAHKWFYTAEIDGILNGPQAT